MNPARLKKLVRRWALPVLALTVLGAVLAFLVSKSLTPVYEATGDVLVVGGPNQSATTNDLALNATQATTTAASLLTEPPLLQQVITSLHLQLAPDTLAKEVTATPKPNTELVDVTVRDPSAVRAAQVANAVMTTYVAEVTNQNAQRINQGGAALEAQIAAVQSAINQEQQQLAAAEHANQDTTALRANISSNTALLTQLTLNYSSFKATQAQGLETVSVAAPASEPTVPASPRVSLNTALGAAIGLLVGLVMAAALEYLDQGLHTADDVVERLDLPCLGLIPRYPTSRTPGEQGTGRRSDRDARAVAAASEAYRRLRTNILFSRPDAELKSVLLTSVRSGEGKTCTAANLAVALASSEKRVLLVDADMRRPDQHRLFGKQLTDGMSDMILRTGRNAVASLNGVHGTQFDNLTLVTSGTIPPNPSELLASERAQALLESFAKKHDVVVIDTPPAGIVVDALALAAHASAVVLVVEAGRTNAGQAAAVVESLRSVGAHVAGIVLNKARTRDVAGYYYQYGGYGDTGKSTSSDGVDTASPASSLPTRS